MGKTKTAFVADTASGGTDGKSKYAKKAAKRSAKTENSVRIPGMGGGERIVAIGADFPTQTPQEQKAVAQGQNTGPKKRGRKYLAAAAKIDPTKKYTVREAVELATATSTSRFAGKLELHVSLEKKNSFEVTLPHATQATQKRVEIATDATIEKLQKGTIDFDVLITTPQMLPRLVPFARLLGPKGLMPNPKNGTVADNPERAMERFSGNSVMLKTEKDAPVIHTVVGALGDPEDHLVENTQAILKVASLANIRKAVMSATMGPGIQISTS